MTRFTLLCYGDPVTLTDEVVHAFESAEQHIRECPRGAMPWAYPRWVWSNGGNVIPPGWTAADGSWLNHVIQVVEEYHAIQVVEDE